MFNLAGWYYRYGATHGMFNLAGWYYRYGATHGMLNLAGWYYRYGATHGMFTWQVGTTVTGGHTECLSGRLVLP
jgi:hypothetical protein